jgi:hypothetical protein
MRMAVPVIVGAAEQPVQPRLGVRVQAEQLRAHIEREVSRRPVAVSQSIFLGRREAAAGAEAAGDALAVRSSRQCRLR